MSGDVLRKSSQVYTYESNTSNALVSPLLAGDEALKNFPPVFIQMGEKEILLEDAKEFAENLRNAQGCCYYLAVLDFAKVSHFNARLYRGRAADLNNRIF